MGAGWKEAGHGVLALPSGRLVRGRGLCRPLPEGPEPRFGLYLTGSAPAEQGWSMRWLRWPDFWLPLDRDDAAEALRELWRRADTERVEVACDHGHGRTGTALACLAVLDGLSAGDAIEYVRTRYDSRAVETPWQRWYVGSFRYTDRASPGGVWT
ncbi:MAG: protein phosphatase [Propionibacteriales bacterium]|nr:protein phosphatase [Propionibacteriales bacterium]